MERQTYQQILEKLKDVDSWLSNLGFSQKADRVHLHISNVHKLEEMWQDETLKKELIKEVGHAQLFWSLIEAAEFGEIYVALRDLEPNSLKEKLRDALEGPINPVEETPISNIGRNTMFELNLAGRLSQRGVPVHLQTNPDILCEIDNCKIYIQCKRPFSERNIPRNVSDARRQLTRDLNGSEDTRARGVIAISVSRVQNPGNKLFTAKTEGDMPRLLGDYVQTLGEEYSKSWKRIVDTRIIGILFHLITPAVVEEINLLTVAQQIVTFPLSFANNSDRLLFRRFCQILL